MKKNIIIASIITNILLLGVSAFHWQYIGLKYDSPHTPSLTCRQLGAAYMARNENIVTALDEKFSINDTADLSPEESKLFRQSVFIQDNAEEIEKLCNQKISE